MKERVHGVLATKVYNAIFLQFDEILHIDNKIRLALDCHFLSIEIRGCWVRADCFSLGRKFSLKSPDSTHVLRFRCAPIIQSIPSNIYSTFQSKIVKELRRAMLSLPFMHESTHSENSEAS